MRSLDEFNRYIEQGGEKRAAVLPSPSSALGEEKVVPGSVRYVLRGGITIAVPSKHESPHPVPNGAAVNSGEAAAEPPRGPETASSASSASVLESRDNGEEIQREALLWQRLPRHIQLLVRIADVQEEEAAQKYYTRGFKESRRQLIERLLDPTLTLEDTARVLGVVPATVRRYTNRGVLPHHRTVGQQRRFRLSDVLAFLEAQRGNSLSESESHSATGK